MKTIKISSYRGGHYVVRNERFDWEFVLFFKGQWFSHQFRFTTLKNKPYTWKEQLDCIQAVRYAAEMTIARVREQRSLLVRLGIKKPTDMEQKQPTYREGEGSGQEKSQEQASYRQGEEGSQEAGYSQPQNAFRSEGGK